MKANWNFIETWGKGFGRGAREAWVRTGLDEEGFVIGFMGKPRRLVASSKDVVYVFTDGEWKKT